MTIGHSCHTSCFTFTPSTCELWASVAYLDTEGRRKPHPHSLDNFTLLSCGALGRAQRGVCEMKWWDMEAGRLQQAGRLTEGEKDELYSDEEVNRAVVYTREDLIMVVSYLSSLNRQIATIKVILAALLAVAGYAAFRLGL